MMRTLFNAHCFFSHSFATSIASGFTLNAEAEAIKIYRFQCCFSSGVIHFSIQTVFSRLNGFWILSDSFVDETSYRNGANTVQNFLLWIPVAIFYGAISTTPFRFLWNIETNKFQWLSKILASFECCWQTCA